MKARLLLLCLSATCYLDVAHGGEVQVVWSDPSCPTFVAKLQDEYGVYETRSGAKAEEGDRLSGDVSGEGIVALQNQTKNAATSAILIATAGSVKALVYSMATVACQRRFK